MNLSDIIKPYLQFIMIKEIIHTIPLVDYAAS